MGDKRKQSTRHDGAMDALAAPLQAEPAFNSRQRAQQGGATLSDENTRVNGAGQPVYLRTDPSQQLGYIVAVMAKGPYQALVRWTEAEPTFESLDDLIEAP